MKTHIKHLSLLPVLLTGLGLPLAGPVTAQTFTSLHLFTGGTDGGTPISGLILSGNALYGAAYSGGNSGYGTVFKVNTDGTDFKVLELFNGLNNEAAPETGLLLSGSILYGASGGPGTTTGALFGVNTNGTDFTTLHILTELSGPSYTNSDGAFVFGALILSGNTLYGTATSGGSAGNGTVFAVNTDGTGFTTLHSFSVGGTNSSGGYTNSEGAYPLGVLILSGHTLYGTANIGGSSGYGTVFAINTNGTGFTTPHSFTGGGDGAYPRAGLVLSGNTFFGTARSVFSISFPPPRLSITASGTNAVLTWPMGYLGFDYSGYTLQSSTNLGSAAVWGERFSGPNRRQREIHGDEFHLQLTGVLPIEPVVCAMRGNQTMQTQSQPVIADIGLSQTYEPTFPHHGRRWMKQTLPVLLSLIVLSTPRAAKAQVESLVASNTAFALNLYAELAATNGNLFFSPYSISTCLGMLYAGARGDTEQQLSQVLGFSTNQQQFATLFGELQDELETNQQPNAVELNIANALWIQENYPFLPAFLETATNQYQASVSQADFTTQAAEVTQTINNWVAQETQDKIQNCVPPGLIDANTRLVLANAIYFLGVWTASFEETNTSTQPFYVSSTNEVPAPLMYQPKVGLNYMETGDFQAVELPYGSNQLASMVILLPWQVDGLGQLEEQLSPAFLSSTLAGMYKGDVELFLPRFTLASSFELSDTLAAMGMPDAFANGVADFSGIDGTSNLFVTFVIHKAWGEVNEAGTEAAAATVVGVGGGASPPPPPPIFRADHPFIFLIRDTESGSLLFLGRLTNPSPSATPAPAPQLTTMRSGNTLILSWPYPLLDWAVEQNPDLTMTNWTPASGSISNDGTNNFMTIPPAAGQLFFRLSHVLSPQPGGLQR